MWQIIKQTKQDESKPKNNSKDNCYTNNKVNSETESFIASPNTGKDKATSSETTIKVHNEFSHMSTGIGCFKDTFLLS